MNWQKSLKGKVRSGVPLKKYTTFKIGGKAELFIEPDNTADLESVVRLLKKNRLPFFVIGSGSNILVSDKGVKAAVVHLSSPAFRKITFKGNIIEAGSGINLKELISKAIGGNLSGIEFLSGIPGTLGGALAMNAGAAGKKIGDLVLSARVMDYSGNIRVLSQKKLKFGYRRSSLQKYIILGASLKLSKSCRSEIRQEIIRLLNYRRGTQDYVHPSAGCIFKNPAGDSAGRLIDLCGLKAKISGGAQISKIHANFIINKSGATCADVLKLMRLIQAKVKKRFHINLEPEIKIWR